jgi:hypothetical protein
MFISWIAFFGVILLSGVPIRVVLSKFVFTPVILQAFALSSLSSFESIDSDCKSRLFLQIAIRAPSSLIPSINLESAQKPFSSPSFSIIQTTQYKVQHSYIATLLPLFLLKISFSLFGEIHLSLPYFSCSSRYSRRRVGGVSAGDNSPGRSSSSCHFGVSRMPS